MDASWDGALGHCDLGLDLTLFKKQLFQNMVMLDIKLKGMKCITTDKQNRKVGHPFTMVMYTRGGSGGGFL